jgi:predicted ChrR family anti-sigma factor
LKTPSEVSASLSFTGLLALAGEPSKVQWEPFHQGVRICRLQGDPASAPAAALLMYEAGASVPRHTHQGWEYILVLSGSQEDEHGVYESGTLKVNSPGSSHNVSSSQGCVVLAIWERSVKFVGSADAGL